MSTKTKHGVFLHVLDPPAPDAAGWTRLSGAEVLAGEMLRLFGEEATVPAQVSNSGELLVRLPAGADEAIDTILAAPNAD